MGQGRVKLGKGVGIHLVHDRARGQPAVDDVYGRIGELPRDIRPSVFQQPEFLPHDIDRRLLLLEPLRSSPV